MDGELQSHELPNFPFQGWNQVITPLVRNILRIGGHFVNIATPKWSFCEYFGLKVVIL
jgi:hypothetical protein